MLAQRARRRASTLLCGAVIRLAPYATGTKASGKGGRPDEAPPTPEAVAAAGAAPAMGRRKRQPGAGGAIDRGAMAQTEGGRGPLESILDPSHLREQAHRFDAGGRCAKGNAPKRGALAAAERHNTREDINGLY